MLNTILWAFQKCIFTVLFTMVMPSISLNRSFRKNRFIFAVSGAFHTKITSFGRNCCTSCMFYLIKSIKNIIKQIRSRLIRLMLECEFEQNTFWPVFDFGPGSVVSSGSVFIFKVWELTCKSWSYRSPSPCWVLHAGKDTLILYSRYRCQDNQANRHIDTFPACSCIASQ